MGVYWVFVVRVIDTVELLDISCRVVVLLGTLPQGCVNCFLRDTGTHALGPMAVGRRLKGYRH